MVDVDVDYDGGLGWAGLGRIDVVGRTSFARLNGCLSSPWVRWVQFMLCRSSLKRC